MELPLELLFVIGLLASVIVWGLKKVFVNKGKKVPAGVLTVGVYIASYLLAFAFFPVILPPFPPFGDLPSFVTALIAYLPAVIPVISAFVGSATLIYQALLKRILDGLEKFAGWLTGKG